MNKGIIYLIQPAELVSTNRYKIGCSSCPNLKRCNNGYKKGSRYICIMECINPFELENKIKCEFNKIFKLIAGKEFYEGKEKILIEKFIFITTSHNNLKNQKEELNLRKIANQKEKLNLRKIANQKEELNLRNIINDAQKIRKIENDAQKEKLNSNSDSDSDHYSESDVIVIMKSDSDCDSEIDSNSYNNSNSDSECDSEIDSNSYNNSNSDSNSDYDSDHYSESDSDVEISTYEEFLNISDINKIVITDLTNKFGYLKFNNINNIWHNISDIEPLNCWLEHNHKVYYDIHNTKKKLKSYELNYDKIINDICVKCYDNKFVEYKLKYNKYLINSEENINKFYIIDTKKFNHIEYNNNINVLTYKNKGNRSIHLNNFENLNINIVNDILNALINNNNILISYKKICYNILVEEIEDIIFFDYSTKNHLLATWLKDILFTITPNDETIIYMYSFNYPDKDYINIIKKNKPRIVMIFCNFNTTDKQLYNIVNKVKKIEIKNIYICVKNKNMYNFREYFIWLNNNKVTIKNNITKNDTERFKCLFLDDIDKESNIGGTDDIFYFQDLLLNNYLKWCCTK